MKDRFKKGHHIKLIQAGSVFWPDEPETFRAQIRQSHAAVAGFNQIVMGGESK